mmetsp:Transcript_24694/g.51357  ORF Transcript_24694/g.51357 Transcript_24694/m.51357 type:complete len:123 (-) Transcript_24694:1976-2344(-)
MKFMLNGIKLKRKMLISLFSNQSWFASIDPCRIQAQKHKAYHSSQSQSISICFQKGKIPNQDCLLILHMFWGQLLDRSQTFFCLLLPTVLTRPPTKSADARPFKSGRTFKASAIPIVVAFSN